MRKLVLVMLVADCLATAFAQTNEVITIKGSDTMVLLAQRWAENYMLKNPNVEIQVNGGGSGTGISSLINGTTDICDASRPMKPSERQRLRERFNTFGVEVKAAKDGLSFYVNNNNPIEELTLDQVRKIYLGEINNWKEVGGRDAHISLYGREGNSGTFLYVKDNILQGEDFADDVLSMPGTASVVNAVIKDRNGIGYGGVAYGRGLRELRLKKDANSEAYAPTLENVRSGKYPIVRYLYLYLRNRPSGAVKEFIDWILSDEGQSIVDKVGYFPIR